MRYLHKAVVQILHLKSTGSPLTLPAVTVADPPSPVPEGRKGDKRVHGMDIFMCAHTHAIALHLLLPVAMVTDQSGEHTTSAEFHWRVPVVDVASPAAGPEAHSRGAATVGRPSERKKEH